MSSTVDPPAQAYGAFVRRSTLPISLLVQSATSAAALAPTVAAPLLLQRLELPRLAVGLYIGLVYLAAMFSSALGAQLVRRFGPIRASQVALLLCVLGLGLLMLPAWPLAALGALVIGLGYGPITPASSQMLARTTALKHYALVFSIKQTGVPLGGVIAGLLVPLLVSLQGVPDGLRGLAGAPAALLGTALLCLLALLLCLPLRSALDRERDRTSALPTPRHVLAPLRVVLGHPVLRKLALSSFVFSMVQVSLTSFLVSLLTGDLGWTLVAAGAALSASQAAGVVGRILWGLVSDHGLGPRRMLLALALAMLVCCGLMPFVGPGSAPALVIALVVVFGATAVGWNGVYLATVARVVPHEQAATATAGTLFFTFFGVVLGPPLFGSLGTAIGHLGPAFALLVLPLAVPVWTLARARWGA